MPSIHLTGPDGDFQTQEPALLQLKGHPDHLPDVLRGHVWWRLLLQRYLPRGYSGENMFKCRHAQDVTSRLYEVMPDIKTLSVLKGASFFSRNIIGSQIVNAWGITCKLLVISYCRVCIWNPKLTLNFSHYTAITMKQHGFLQRPFKFKLNRTAEFSSGSK